MVGGPDREARDGWLLKEIARTMLVVFLRFSDEQARAAEFMSAHVAWIRRGVDDGVFLLVGSLKPQAGGAILADKLTREDLDRRLNDDPFVQENVVRAEVFEVAPNLADPRLQFLVAGA